MVCQYIWYLKPQDYRDHQETKDDTEELQVESSEVSSVKRWGVGKNLSRKTEEEPLE